MKVCLTKEQNIPLHSQIETFILYKDILRGGAEVARWAHNPKAVGSNPAPATTESPAHCAGDFCFFGGCKLVCRSAEKAKIHSERSSRGLHCKVLPNQDHDSNPACFLGQIRRKSKNP